MVSLLSPVCAALRQGLLISVPLRGTTSCSVSIMLCYPYKVLSEALYPLNIFHASRSTLHASLFRHPAVVPRRGTLMSNPSLSVAQTGDKSDTIFPCLGEVHAP